MVLGDPVKELLDSHRGRDPQVENHSPRTTHHLLYLCATYLTQGAPEPPSFSFARRCTHTQGDLESTYWVHPVQRRVSVLTSKTCFSSAELMLFGLKLKGGMNLSLKPGGTLSICLLR